MSKSARVNLNVSGEFITDNQARYGEINGKNSVMFRGDDCAFTVTVDGNRMRVLKRGEFTYELNFDTQNPSPVIITTPMGRLSDFTLTTKKLEIIRFDTGFSVFAEYTLSIDPDLKTLTLTCETE